MQVSEKLGVLAYWPSSEAGELTLSLLSQTRGGVAITASCGLGQPGNDFGQVRFFNQAKDRNDQVEFTAVRMQKRALQG